MKTSRLAYVLPLGLLIASFASAQEAPATASASARQFRLILLDDANQPVEGAEVAVIASTNPKEPAVGKTDARGRCTVAVPAVRAEQWTFKITKTGHIPLRTWMSAGSAEKLFTEETTLRITKGQTIGGVVNDEQGRPIKDVILGFYWLNEKKQRQPVRDDLDLIPVRTDANGQWVCDFAPPELDDNFRIFLRHPEYVSDYWGNSIPSSKYPRPSPDHLWSQKAVYVIKAGVVLTGKVTDAQSKPVSGAQVRIMEGSGLGYDVRAVNAQRTKADGSFTFKDAESAQGSLLVTAKGFAPDIFPFDMGKDAPLVIKLTPAQVMRGKVIDARGMPVEGVSLYVSQWRCLYDLLQFSTETDKNGCFAWSEVPADGATFTFYKQGYMRHDNVVLLPTETEHLVTLGDPLRVSGSVVDAETGKPIDGARIIRGIDWGRGGRPSWQRRDQVPVKDGTYQMEMDGSYAGYVLRAEADGYTPAVSESIPRDAGRRTVDFRMVKGKPIVGRVLGPDGKPLAGVEVHVATADQQAYISNSMEFEDRRNAAMVTTAADGSFSLPPADQDFTIVVLADAGYAEVGNADLEKSPQVRLAPWGRIEGVVMQGTKPLPRTRVGAGIISNVDLLAFHDLGVTTDAQGRFVLPHVPPGQYWVRREISLGDGLYSGACTETLTVEAGKSKTVTLGGHGRLVVGRLNRPVARGGTDYSSAVIVSAACAAIQRQQKELLPPDYGKMDAAQRGKWHRQWAESEQGKAFLKLEEEIRRKEMPRRALLYSGGKLEAYDVPPGQYVLMVNVGRVVAGSYEPPQATAERAFEVPPLTGNDLDTPLNLGVLELTSAVVVPVETGPGQRGAARTDQEAPKPPAATSVLNQPLKLDLAAGLAGRKLLVVAASIEQRPSRRILDMLAAQADAVAKQGFAIVLVHPAVTDEKQVKQWLKDHKLDAAQVILAKDQADAAKLMTACGAESLPSMLLASDKHAVTALNVQADKLGTLGDIPAGTQQSTTRPAPSAGRQPTTSPAAAAAGGAK